jgi:uncharacterized cupredoxin-like copper-binding protein
MEHPEPGTRAASKTMPLRGKKIMLRSRTRIGAVGSAALVAALMLTLSSCGDTATSTEQSVTTQPAATTVPGSIAVSLGENGSSMFLTPAVTSAPAGSVTFVVTNVGAVEHEFVVLKTDFAAADLPMNEEGTEAIEEGDGVTPVDEIGSILPGETKSLTVDLEAGHYVLVCNIAGHYLMGMRSDFTAQ